ncbi:hypothetical protein F5890DRAFT_1593442, partial [Lentinula detonsa]
MTIRETGAQTGAGDEAGVRVSIANPYKMIITMDKALGLFICGRRHTLSVILLCKTPEMTENETLWADSMVLYSICNAQREYISRCASSFVSVTGNVQAGPRRYRPRVYGSFLTGGLSDCGYCFPSSGKPVAAVGGIGIGIGVDPSLGSWSVRQRPTDMPYPFTSRLSEFETPTKARSLSKQSSTLVLDYVEIPMAKTTLVHLSVVLAWDHGNTTRDMGDK